MIADDSEMNRSILTDMLGAEYDIMEAENGVEAVSLLQKYGNSISLILLDILMPEMDGFEVMKEIRANQAWADIPVIFLTGDVSPQTCAKGGALGVTGFMAKPLEAERMISGIEAVIGK